jgi:hypothetical protein
MPSLDLSPDAVLAAMPGLDRIFADGQSVRYSIRCSVSEHLPLPLSNENARGLLPDRKLNDVA